MSDSWPNISRSALFITTSNEIFSKIDEGHIPGLVERVVLERDATRPSFQPLASFQEPSLWRHARPTPSCSRSPTKTLWWDSRQVSSLFFFFGSVRIGVTTPADSWPRQTSGWLLRRERWSSIQAYVSSLLSNEGPTPLPIR